MRVKTPIIAVIMSMIAIPSYAQDNRTLFENESLTQFETRNGEQTDAVAGHLYVPENRNNADSKKIRVNYIRFPSTSDNPGNPIVYLSGGPGGSGTATAKGPRFSMFMALREFGDVIALDQRGTGLSEKAERCVSSESISLTTKVNIESVKGTYNKAAMECLRLWQSQNIDVYGYTTVQNALDINDLRKHLDARKVTLWGISYGSHLALSAMKLFPQNIENVVIASAEGLDQTVKQPAQTDQYFQAVQEVIDQQPLKQRVNDLPALMHRVHDRLSKEPLSLAIPNRDGSKTDLLFQKEHMQMIASMMIADPGQFLAMLIQMYLELDSGKTDTLLGILQRGIFKDEPISFSLMSLAMDVASGVTEKRLKMIDEQAQTSLLGYFLNFPMPFLNNLDSKLDLGDEFRAGPDSDIPTLLLTGSLDGRTYPMEQAEAVKGLTQLTHITVQNAGHNLYMTTPEVLTRVETFLANKAVDKSDIVLPLPQLSMR